MNFAKEWMKTLYERGFIFFRNYTLMSSKALIAFFVVLVLTGCFHPVSNMFETAYSLDPGDVRVSVAGSLNPEGANSLSGSSLAVLVDQGLTSSSDIRFRFEKRFENDLYGFELPYTFLELAPKWSNKAGKGIAFSLPLQLYLLEDEQFLFTEPRLILSGRRDKAEITGTLGGKMTSVDGEFGILPSASLGFGFSQDFRKNCFRLDIGYTIGNAPSVGIAFQTILSKGNSTVKD